jgi:uncharacterized secreted protein with C-terminal beta-propeller domain
MPAKVIVLSVSMLILISTFHSSSAQPTTIKSTTKNLNSTPTFRITNQFVNTTTSIPVFPLFIKALRPAIHVSLNNATTDAIKAVGSSSLAVSTNLQSIRGFLVYAVTVLDSNNLVHLVMVDPGSGQVISNQQLPSGVISSSIMGLGGGFISPSLGLVR